MRYTKTPAKIHIYCHDKLLQVAKLFQAVCLQYFTCDCVYSFITH